MPLPLPVLATIEMAPSVIRRLAITAKTTKAKQIARIAPHELA